MPGSTAAYGIPYPIAGDTLRSAVQATPQAMAEQIAATINALTGGTIATWSTYTPVWTATTTNPVKGNGSVDGRYVALGKTVHFYIVVSIGSTTTFGAGRWEFTLPRTPIAYASLFTTFGRAMARDVGVRNYGGDVVYTAPDKVHVWRDAGATEATFTPTTPHTWATGDYLIMMGTYESV